MPNMRESFVVRIELLADPSIGHLLSHTEGDASTKSGLEVGDFASNPPRFGYRHLGAWKQVAAWWYAYLCLCTSRTIFLG